MYDILQTATSVQIERNKVLFQTLDLSACLKYDEDRQAVLIEDQFGRSISLKSRDVDNTKTNGGLLTPFSGSNSDLINLLILDFFIDPRVSLAINNYIFGSAYQFAKDDTESTTVSNLFQNKLTLNAVGLVVGFTYTVKFYFETSSSSTSRSVAARVQIDGASIMETQIENKNASNYYPQSGFDDFVAVATTATITIDWAKIGAGAELARIRRSRLKIYRVL